MPQGWEIDSINPGTTSPATDVQRLVDGLNSLRSLFSGATEPPVADQVAHMPWAHTTTGLLKMRNAANSDWVTIGTMDSLNLGLLSRAGGTLTGSLVQAVGAPVASAATLDLTAVAGNACHVTGTVGVTAVTLAAGKWCLVIFDGIVPLSHHATNQNLTDGLSFTTIAGSRVLYWSDGTTVYGMPIGNADLGAAQTFTKAQRGAIVAIPATTGAVTLDLSLANNFGGTLTGNITLANPTGMAEAVGQSGTIALVNGATPYTIAYGSYFKGPSGVLPTLTPDANAKDTLAYYVDSATQITITVLGDIR